MKWFIDQEFHEDGRIIELISIGLVSEAGHSFYAISTEFTPALCNQWVRENVLNKLETQHPNSVIWLPRAKIRAGIEKMFKAFDPKPEIWGYYADYDWVCFCQLWGRMVDLPRGESLKLPMYCLDLKQVLHEAGLKADDIPIKQDPNTEHHAEADARWNRDLYNWLHRMGYVS